MKVLICGSRDAGLEVLEKIKKAIVAAEPEVIIQGGARGVDALAKMAAMQLGIECQEFAADWATHGKAAGPIRNQKMLDEGKPDMVIAFHPKSGITPGTKDMVNRAKRAGLIIFCFTY